MHTTGRTLRLSPAVALPFVRVIAVAAVWAVLWYPLHGELLAQTLQSRFSLGAAFVYGVAISFVVVAVFELAFLAALLRIDHVRDIRAFFKVERLDVRGIWLTMGAGIALQIANALFLWQAVLRPARDFLASLGMSGAAIGLGSGENVPPLSVEQAIFLTLFLLVFWWVEVPEEMFFRGYVQNRLQGIVGKNAALLLSALIWDLSHLWGLVNLTERFVYGLLYAAVFRVRQNTTPTMIVHPIGNRVVLLMVILPQIWGATADTRSPWFWLAATGLYAGLLLAVIGAWQALKLDRQPQLSTATD